MSAIYDLLRHMLQSLSCSGYIPTVMGDIFVENSLLGLLMISPVFAVIGSMVVAKRLAFFTNAVGHAALTGVAIGIIIGEPVASPYISVFSFTILFAIYMNFTKNHTGMSPGILIGISLATSLAVGSSLLFFFFFYINLHILDSIMFGNILLVNDNDLNILLIITVLTTTLSLKYYNRMILASFNKTVADIRGVKTTAIDYLFIGMITIITVASIKIVGAVLVEALMLIPVAASRNVSWSLKSFILFALFFATSSSIIGIITPIQFHIPIPPGVAIIITSAIIFFITLPLRFQNL